MTLHQKRKRRIELMIDSRLIAFLKPSMTVASPILVSETTSNAVPNIPVSKETKPKHKAS